MMKLKNILKLLLLALSLVLIFLFLTKKCQRYEVKQTYYIQRIDTIYKIDTLKIEKAKEYVKIVAKTDTIENQKVIYDTIYLFNLFKYQYKDTLIYIEFMANYVDTTSLKYSIFKKEQKLKPTYKNNIITIYTKGDLNIGLIYHKRIFYNFYMNVLLEKRFSDYSIGVGISYSF